MTRHANAVALVALALLSPDALASTPAPSLKPKMWRDSAIKCVPVDPNEPEGAKYKIPTTITPAYLPPFHGTTWTFRFLNADLQASWTQEAITAVADAAKHWSNQPGSSIQGVFDWTMGFDTTDPTMVASGVSTQDVLCNGESDIFYVNDLALYCTGSASTYGCVRHMYEEGSDKISEIDIALLAPGSGTWSYTGTPSTVPNGTVPMRYVALHELGHAIGLVHDNKWPDDPNTDFGKANNVMDAYLKLGGDFGGPVPGTPANGLQGILRVTGGELWALAAAMGQGTSPGSVLNPNFGNLALRRFAPTHADNWPMTLTSETESVELWSDEHDELHGADWSWRACDAVAWPTEDLGADSPQNGFHPIQAAALTAGGSGGTAKVEWFLSLPGEVCGAVPDRKIGWQYANPDPQTGAADALDAGIAYWAGHFDAQAGSAWFRTLQKSAVAINTSYHVCAKISAEGTSTGVIDRPWCCYP